MDIDSGEDIEGWHLTLCTLFAVFSWPMVWAFRLCQPTVVVAFFVATGTYLLCRELDVAAGLLFACATIKPQLIVPVVAWLFLWAVLRKRWRFILSFVVATLGLLLYSSYRIPGWVASWRAAMATMYQHDAGTRPFFQLLFGRSGGTTLMVAVAIAGAARLWQLRKCAPGSPQFGLAVALALALAVSLIPGNPAMIYNQILLLPGIMILVTMPSLRGSYELIRKGALIALVWGFVAVAIGAAFASLGNRFHFLYVLPFINPLLPILVTAAIGLQGPITATTAREESVPEAGPLDVRDLTSPQQAMCGLFSSTWRAVQPTRVY